MKTIIFLVVLFSSQFLFAHENKTCGQVERFSKHRDGGGRFYEIQFHKGPQISNVQIELGEESLLATSMTMGIKVCFIKGSGSEYELSSVYQYGNP